MNQRGAKGAALPLALWREIELACVAGMPFPEAEKRFGVKANTIRIYAQRHGWPTPNAVIRRTKELTKLGDPAANALEKVAASWKEKGEAHRSEVFARTRKAITESDIGPPTNWKDFEIVDKVARRSAGLENNEVVQQTLVNINEAPDSDVIDLHPGPESPESPSIAS